MIAGSAAGVPLASIAVAICGLSTGEGEVNTPAFEGVRDSVSYGARGAAVDVQVHGTEYAVGDADVHPGLQDGEVKLSQSFRMMIRYRSFVPASRAFTFCVFTAYAFSRFSLRTSLAR